MSEGGPTATLLRRRFSDDAGVGEHVGGDVILEEPAGQARRGVMATVATTMIPAIVSQPVAPQFIARNV